jgi:hypothetical protein
VSTSSYLGQYAPWTPITEYDKWSK